MNTSHRNPSKHRIEEHLMLNWMKHQRKLMNKGELRADRVELFRILITKGERLKRTNQWVDVAEEIMNNDILRNYQQEMLDKVQEAWTRCRSVMVQMPTGTGKTVLMAEVIRRSLTPNPIPEQSSPTRSLSPKGEGSSYQNGGILIVAHRRELLEQIRETVEFFGIDMEKEHVVVESIQKLSRGSLPLTPPKGEGNFNPSLVIIDEAHHALAETYRMLWERWPEARFLGLTATPCRLGGEPFTDLFDVLVQSWSVREFIDKGWLSDLDYISVKGDSPAVRKVAGLDKRGTDGDYQTRQTALVLDTEESIGHLYRSYKQFADGKKGIVYAINRDHAQHIATYYQEQGVRCAVIDSKTPAKVRRKAVEDYRQQALDVLVNCEIFGEGFDVPEVEFIQLARPTLSLALFLQQVGRGMRVSEGKDRVIILDQVGLYLSMGMPTAERDWQGMFLGEIKGKGLPLSAYRMTEIEMAVCKMLVNEEMVRLSDFERMKAELQQEWDRQQQQKEEEERRQQRERSARIRRETIRAAREDELARVEWHGSLGIFKERGLYGIRRKDDICLPAAYEQIKVLYPEKGRYFALARLPMAMSGSNGLWTVITKESEDLHARIEGEFNEQRDDVFEFRKTEHGRFVILHWDARYDRYYEGMQQITMGGVEFFADSSGEYTLRAANDFKGKFSGEDVLFNDHITIIDNDLFVKNGEVEHYSIAGFLDDRVIIEQDNGKHNGWTEITADGQAGNGLAELPQGMTSVPLLRSLGLQREFRKKYGERSKLARDYQQEMLDSLERSFKHSKRVVLQIPTGAGKNFVVSRFMRQEWKRIRSRSSYWDNEILIVTHRPELKRQISKSLERHGFPHAIISPRFTGPYGYDDVTLIDAQTVPLFASKVNRIFSPALIIIDEVHTAGKSLCEMLMRRFPEARMLGLSATPCTENPKESLSRVFKRLLSSWSMKSLVAGGWLRDVDVKPVSGGTKNAELLYQAYKEHAKGKKGVVFANDSRHAKSIADCYQRHGIKSEVIGFGDKAEVQEWKLNEFEAGITQVLVCVDYFSDGMRCPDVDFVQLANNTDSLNTYLHQVSCAMHPGKDEEYGEDGSTVELRRLTVLDHAGLSVKFGLPTDERDWAQQFTGKLKKKSTRKAVTKKKKEMPVEPKPAAQTKWQLRMERLLGTTPQEDVAVRRI